ncbi:hypothetical protein W97_07269 [Coniosporium apollinis CBS 100218]|uniref:BTB domain-containing protein n=1 Tax=Coniosporium apollinis (strain CBS 100218) TaxID=1168221 RepID=R7Z2J8_CONA1|nr:uncharacterized protein W97_07269 [Coniosporium apollinis CBS 100218]EON68121.1 hypothetical protein W97_07269 [Coniosporium apollinis CBS 100218]
MDLNQQHEEQQGDSDDLHYLASTLNLDPSSRTLSWSNDRQAPTPSGASRPSLFSSASGSLFSSGPSASAQLTVDAGRAASQPVSPPDGSRPTAGRASASPNNSRRTARFDDDRPSIIPANTTSISRAEKDVDDPNAPSDGRRSLERREHTTLTTLSRLFAAQASLNSPDPSRTSSHNYAVSSLARRSSEGATLPDHLYTRGLLAGRHSDITVIAFDHKYRLHRLLLDRAPFFTTALSEPWLESQAKEVTLHPEEIDSTITQNAFELAIKRLYGCDIAAEEDAEAIGLFATGCWLEMQDLIDSSIDAILRQMSPQTLSPLVKLVTTNYYGRAGERILASAKAMLCRDGWEMPLKYWDDIPGDTIREIVGGDGFFIDSEWDRWVLAKRLLDRRLRQKAVEAGLIEPGKKSKIRVPDMLGLMAVRFDTVYRRNAVGFGLATPDSHHRWLALYTHPEIEPLLVLLDEGIHYVHLDFEQLQYIRQARDILGLPVMPEPVITNALWQQIELRQRVVNARDLDLELGLSKVAEEPATTTNARDSSQSAKASSPQSAKGKQKMADTVPEEEEDDMESGSWDANGKPRKFWIPSTDCNIVMGGTAEPVVTTSNAFQRHASRLSATLQPEDVQWAMDFGTSPSTTDTGVARTSTTARPNSSSGSTIPLKPIAYTHFPPFRFSAEFPNPRLIKEKKRVYSRTVFYAGSLWNIYIQKVRSAKNPQLGVYLHRAKEREAEDVIAGSAGGLAQGTVDERIGLLEREMLLRSERRERRRGRGVRPEQTDAGLGAEDDTSGSGGDPDATLVSTGSAGSASRPSLLSRRFQQRAASASDVTLPARLSNVNTGAPSAGNTSGMLNFPNFSDSDAEDGSGDENTGGGSDRPRGQPHPSVKTLPAYVDARPTIKTYFKIYSPSKGGRLLSVYESAPDRFNFSQSWGWKSSTLMLEDATPGAGGEGDKGMEGMLGQGKRKEGRLRFMVVIGNL